MKAQKKAQDMPPAEGNRSAFKDVDSTMMTNQVRLKHHIENADITSISEQTAAMSEADLHRIPKYLGIRNNNPPQ